MGFVKGFNPTPARYPDFEALALVSCVDPVLNEERVRVVPFVHHLLAGLRLQLQKGLMDSGFQEGVGCGGQEGSGYLPFGRRCQHTVSREEARIRGDQGLLGSKTLHEFSDVEGSGSPECYQNELGRIESTLYRNDSEGPLHGCIGNA